MSFSADQAQALVNLAEALKGTTIEDFIKSNIGQAPKTASPPVPTSEDKSPAPESKQPELLQELHHADKPAPASISTFLAIHTKNYVQRDVNTTRSQYVPTMKMFYYILNEMDTILSDNYYARRALPFFYPTVTRLYFAVLIHYQLLRVAAYNNSISPEAKSFLDFLEDSFPPETLPIPAPLLPIFQALTTSTPENKRLRRVFPSHPTDYLNDQRLSDRYDRTSATSTADWHLPFIPFFAAFHHHVMSPFTGTFTLGADDSQVAGRKTVNATALPGYDYIIDVIHHPRSAVRRQYFPMTIESRTNNGTPNATNNVNDAIRSNMFGVQINDVFQNFTDANKQRATKCGLFEPIKVHKDLTAQLKVNFSRIPVPEVDNDNTFPTWREFFLMEESSQWMTDLASTMAGYCLFFPNSGSLASASLEGPRTGQYIATISTPAVLTPRPQFFGDERAIREFDAHLTTTVSEEEPVTELLARYSQVNTRMYPTHPWLGALGSNVGRSGPFWTVRPLYEQGTTSGAWIQVPQMLKSAVVERPLGKKVE